MSAEQERADQEFDNPKSLGKRIFNGDIIHFDRDTGKVTSHFTHILGGYTQVFDSPYLGVNESTLEESKTAIKNIFER